ncbi:hypothetical protein B484DRAFT_472256 [Ochromonadaceae sp. CCMP2298]|nr:hypothetical protein B484DRAFT_472256 [Ochromonadaceae sp. CCMP2298]
MSDVESEFELGILDLMGDLGTERAINHLLGTPGREMLMWMVRTEVAHIPPVLNPLCQFTLDCIWYLRADEDRLGQYDAEQMRRGAGEAASSISDTADLFLAAMEEAEDAQAMQTSDDSPENAVLSYLSVSPGAVPEETPAVAPAQPRRRRVRVVARKTTHRGRSASDEEGDIWEDRDP